jgi:3-oxoacyl-[acyl-carrier protein] reductase
MTFVQQAVDGSPLKPNTEVNLRIERPEASVQLIDRERRQPVLFEIDDFPLAYAGASGDVGLRDPRPDAKDAMQSSDFGALHVGRIFVSAAYQPLTLGPMIDLSGKSAIVTGGSRGIGKQIALRLAKQGADICFSYRGNATAAEQTKTEIEALDRKAVAFQADVTQPESAEALVKAALEAFGKVDILVNNAGITRDDLIMRMSVEAWREVLETNLFGAFYTLKAVTRPMLRARSGRIIQITSVSGQAGQMGQANYSSAKAGLIGLTKAAARELGSRGITVNAVAPGFVLTELTEGLSDDLKQQITDRTPLARFGTTEEVAYAVAFLASDEAAYITGQVLAVDGGLVMM